jgi:hypothetical protein
LYRQKSNESNESNGPAHRHLALLGHRATLPLRRCCSNVPLLRPESSYTEDREKSIAVWWARREVTAQARD